MQGECHVIVCVSTSAKATLVVLSAADWHKSPPSSAAIAWSFLCMVTTPAEVPNVMPVDNVWDSETICEHNELCHNLVVTIQ